MRILWTRLASEQLKAAIDFVLTDSHSAAIRQHRLIQRAVQQLADFPGMGRIGRVDGTRELVIQGTPYIAAYKTDRQTVRILALLHGSRRWPTRL